MDEKTSTLEKIAGSPVFEMGATLIASAGAPYTALAALLPVLTNTLASQRQQMRVDQAIKDISLKLGHHKEKLNELTDAQYHILTESISAVFQTISPRKLDYLQLAIENSLSAKDIVPQQSALLARYIRDISAEEADFVVGNFNYAYVHVTNNRHEEEMNALCVPRNSSESLIVAGLEYIGILEIGVGTAGDGNLLRFSNAAAKLLALLKPSEALSEKAP